MTDKSKIIEDVVPHFALAVEDPEVFITNFAEFEAWLQPRSPLEEHLARYMAVSAWRVARMVCLERATVDQTCYDDRIGGKTAGVCARAYSSLTANSRVLDFLGRSEARAFRAFKEALNLFLKVRQQLPPLAETPADLTTEGNDLQ